MIGCADQKSLSPKAYLADDPGKIVGGTDINYKSSLASTVVYISTVNAQGQSTICTGTFIAKNLVLTAAHCIAKSKNSMSMHFRLKSFTPVTNDLKDFRIEEAYKLDFSDLGITRNDLGVIQFSGGLPVGATIATLPQGSAPSVGQVFNFTAVGYGKNTGKELNHPLDSDGSGVLRKKSLVSLPTTNLDTFKIDQLKNDGGVCFGDSGGPALIQDKKTKKYTVIGVASYVSTERKEAPGLDITDDCKNESMYVNMHFYAPYLKTYLQRAIAKKAAEVSAGAGSTIKN